MIQPSFLPLRAASASLASGSSGNSFYFQSGATRLLVDCGISAKRIRESLKQHDAQADELSAVLITHEHSDHICGLAVLARRLRLPVYMSAGTYTEWAARVPDAPNFDVRIIRGGQTFTVGDFEISSFDTPHDAAESLGFCLDDGLRRVGVFTDLGEVNAELLSNLESCRLIYVEANYDDAMLWAGPYPWPLKQRIAGARGHLSNEAAADAVFTLLENGCEEFVLSHLSAENNMPALAELTVTQILQARGAVAGCDYRLRMAPRHLPGPLIEL